jgi:O-antigen/teichoic acid export membrane protein
LYRRAVRVGRTVAYLTVAQSVTQILGLVTGFFLLRWLPITQYAQYTLAFTFGTMVCLLVDLGFGDSMIGVIGEQADDPEIVGSIMKAALSLRWRVCLLVLPLCGVPFFVLASNHGWALGTQVALFASVTVTLLTRSMADYFALPLILRRRYTALYGAQVSASMARLAVTGLLKLARALNGWSSSAVSAASIAATGLSMRRQARGSFAMPAHVNRGHRNAILRVSLPLLPGQVFFAFQGQITTFIAATIGGTASLAQMGALGRLAQIFAVVNALNLYVVVPRIARCSEADLTRKALEALAGMGAVVAPITICVFLYPQPVLLFLGRHYQGLGSPAGWYVLAGSLGVLAGTLYSINVARRFVWWLASVGQVLAIVVAEIFAAFVFNLHSILQLQYFGVLAAVGSLVSQVATFAYGLWRSSQARPPG